MVRTLSAPSPLPGMKNRSPSVPSTRSYTWIPSLVLNHAVHVSPVLGYHQRVGVPADRHGLAPRSRVGIDAQQRVGQRTAAGWNGHQELIVKGIVCEIGRRLVNDQDRQGRQSHHPKDTVFVHPVSVVNRHWLLAPLQYVERHDRIGGEALAVGGPVRERVGAAVVGARRVGEAPVRPKLDGAVLRPTGHQVLKMLPSTSVSFRSRPWGAATVSGVSSSRE